MTWIKTINFEDATGKLKKIYQRVVGSNGKVDNVLKIHSLRPHTLVGHMALYKNVLHNSNNTFPKWYLETLGVYVSQLNDCKYCVEHHAAGLQRLLESEGGQFEKIMFFLKKDKLGKVFEGKYLAGIRYAKRLTLVHQLVSSRDVEALRNAGMDDGEILEVNQVVSYFNYVNRTVIGLGVNTDGDDLGLSPNDSDNPEDWSHS